MRPGQAAPVFGRMDGFRQRLLDGFNEAGAGCPGIPAAAFVQPAAAGFASMRPGQAAPVFQLFSRE